MEVRKVELKLIFMRFEKGIDTIIKKISLGRNYVYNNSYLTFCNFSLILLNIVIFKEFENLSVEKMTLSTALGFEPRSFDCRSTARIPAQSKASFFPQKDFQIL